MSINQKEEDIQTNLNCEDINQLNIFKDEEYLKKINEISYLQDNPTVNDPYILSNKEINCSLSNEWNTAKFPGFLIELLSQNKTNFPIDKYLNNQIEDNMFYQHPNLINEKENDNFILNSFRELEIDLMNKWFENFYYFNYYLSLYHQELFINEERKIKNIDGLKEKIINNLERDINSITNDQTFKNNFILLKISLKELTNISLDNLDEYSSNLNNFEKYSEFLEEHFEISFLLTDEINSLIKKLHSLIDNLLGSDIKNKENLLGKILLYEYNIVFELKSLFGILNFIKKINDIDEKGILNNKIINLLMNKIKTPNLSNLLNCKIEKLPIKFEYKSYIKLSSEELNNNCHLIYINKDIFYLLNDKNKLYKIYKIYNTKNKFNIIEINNNIINSENLFLISLEKEYLFGFNSAEYGKGENVIKLIKNENTTLHVKTIIKMDEISEKLLSKSIINSNEIINNIYLKLFEFEPKEEELFKQIYSSYSENENSFISITQKNLNLYILHPIFKKENNKTIQINYYFFSDNYIYAIDEYELYIEQQSIKEDDECVLYIHFKNNYIIKTNVNYLNALPEEEKDKFKIKYNIDEILKNIKNKNKFIITNKYLCFTDTCQKFYDLNKKRVCIFDKEINENILINDIKEGSNYNSFILNYENYIYNLRIIKTELNNIQEIQETEYKVDNKYYLNNIFSKKRKIISQIHKYINKNLSKTKSSDTQQKENILKKIFQTFVEEENILNNNIINEENNLNENISSYILSNLFILSQELNDLEEINSNFHNLYQNNKSELFNIIKYLKRPFIINIDFPTMKLIEDIIIFNLQKEKDVNQGYLNIFCLLFILDNHLSYMNSLKINSKFIFGNIISLEVLINLLKKISEKNNELKNICSSIIIKLLSIAEDYPNNKITSLFQEILYPIEFMEKQEDLNFYIIFFKYTCYSKHNMKIVISNEVSYKFILDLIDALLGNEKDINISYISEFFNEFILFFNNLISFTIVHISGIKLSNIINGILSTIIKNLSEEKIIKPKILQPLLYNIIIQCLNNYKLLPKDFYLQNWSIIYDILYQIQKIRNDNISNNIIDLDSFKKKDFILDTFHFYSEFPNNKYHEFFSSKTKNEQNNEKEENNAKPTRKEIYISLMSITKPQTIYNKKTSSNKIIEIITIKNNNNEDIIYSFENLKSNNKVEIINKKLENIDIINEVIKIRLYPQSQNYFIKMRISNYQFYNEQLDLLINPLTELMNKIINRFSFYYTNEENKIFNLFQTRLFSKGFSNKSLLTQTDTKDEEKIIYYLKENKNKEFLEYLDANPSKSLIKESTRDEEEINIRKLNNESCSTFLGNEIFNKCIDIFKEKQNIFIRGELPDKIVNISFLVILKHENLLPKFMKYAEELVNKPSVFFPDDLYYIMYNKCNDLRRTYKEKKDEIIKQEKESKLDDIFHEIFNRLFFLFNLNSENMVKKGKEIDNNEIINSYVKEHVNNISQIIKNDEFNLSNILDAYRLLQSQAKFREISLIILNNIIKKFEDQQCVENIIENYYKSYCFSNNINYIKFPNIYESLNSVSENLVLGITNNFNSVINSILEKLTNTKKR